MLCPWGSANECFCFSLISKYLIFMLFSVASLGWCHPGRQLTVSPLFSREKKLTTFFWSSPSPKWWWPFLAVVCRLVTTPTCSGARTRIVNALCAVPGRKSRVYSLLCRAVLLSLVSVAVTLVCSLLLHKHELYTTTHRPDVHKT